MSRDADRVYFAWRRLTGAGPTLLAVSGGADSSALALALAASAARPRLTIGHVVHDLRPPEQAEADRVAVEALAARLGLPVFVAHVQVREHADANETAPTAIPRGPRNLEARARAARYDALARLALEAGARFVATAHHLHDQIETILWRFARGSNAGLSGPAGLRRKRRLRPRARTAGAALSAGEAGPGDARHTDLWLVRPMMALTPDAARQICRDAGWIWREDATNADTTRARAFLRAEVIPPLLARWPNLPRRAAAASTLARDRAAAIDLAAEPLWRARVPGPGEVAFERSALAAAPRAVITHLLVRAARALEPRVADALHARELLRAARLVADGRTEPRELHWRGLRLVVDGSPRGRVTLRRVPVAPPPTPGAPAR